MSTIPQTERWFFLDGRLHRALTVNRAANYVKAYDYIDHRVKMYKWDETLHAKEKAYSVVEASAFVNRKPRTLRFYINEEIMVPSGYAQRGERKPMYFFSKQDVLQLREAIDEYSRRKPYGRTPLPTREQVRSMLAVGSVLYIKDGEDFIPVWEARF